MATGKPTRMMAAPSTSHIVRVLYYFAEVTGRMHLSRLRRVLRTPMSRWHVKLEKSSEV